VVATELELAMAAVACDEHCSLGALAEAALGLLATSTEPEDQVQGGLLLDVVVGQSTTVFELLASKDQTLLVRRDT
jgi:hypothetical protein